MDRRKCAKKKKSETVGSDMLLYMAWRGCMMRFFSDMVGKKSLLLRISYSLTPVIFFGIEEIDEGKPRRTNIILRVSQPVIIFCFLFCFD